MYLQFGVMVARITPQDVQASNMKVLADVGCRLIDADR
jgi:hypothetical protein